MAITRKGKPPANQGGMTALLSTNAAHAASFTPSAEVLTRWYEQQVVAVRAHVAALEGALRERAENTNVLTRVDDPGWADYYALDARYRYSVETLRRIEAAGHVLSCPTHGPFGCGAGLSEDEATALAYRGYIETPGDKLSWQRHCEVCAKGSIDAEAARLLHNHRTGKME